MLFAGLTGAAFAAPITAWSATREQERSFPAINRFVITPLFLFGGAFYPIDQLPDWLQWVAKATPHLARRRAVPRRGARTGSSSARTAGARRLPAGCSSSVGWLIARRTFAERLSS